MALLKYAFRTSGQTIAVFGHLKKVIHFIVFKLVAEKRSHLRIKVLPPYSGNRL